MEVLLTKALVFGGAFNPPTIAHIQLAKFAKDQTDSDVVIFVPSKMTYIRNEQNKDFAFKDNVRFDMLKNISASNLWMIVSNHEILLKDQPRTYSTLCYLKQCGYDCKLLFGSDKLTELETGWKHIEELCKEFGIVCMERNYDNCESLIDNDSYLSSIKQYIQIIQTPDTFQMISSSKVRELFEKKNFEQIDSLVPKELNGLRGYDRKEDTL